VTHPAERHVHLTVRQTTVLAGALWLIAWLAAEPLSEYVAIDLLRLDPGSDLGRAVVLFLFDVPKVLLLLAGTVMVVTYIRSYVPPERVRSLLGGRGTFSSTVTAALFGVVTPLDSCSAVPLFSAFVKAGIPLAATFAFLVSSPMLNGVALLLLWGLLGPAVTLLYFVAGMVVAVASGLVLERLGAEQWIVASVRHLRTGGGADFVDPRLSQQRRILSAWIETRGLLRSTFVWVVLGIAAAAVIEGFVPADFVAKVGGRENALALPIAILIAIPLYSNAAGTIPIVGALLAKSLPLGTTLAFMMAIAALSLPGFVILRQVLQPRLIVLFATVVAIGTYGVGLLFNWLGL
jgi:uncharacterized protein